MTANFGRLVTAMITPMTGEGEVDLTQTAELAKALVASGTESIVSTGTTGESPTLKDEEQYKVWRTVQADAAWLDCAFYSDCGGYFLALHALQCALPNGFEHDRGNQHYTGGTAECYWRKGGKWRFRTCVSHYRKYAG